MATGDDNNDRERRPRSSETGGSAPRVMIADDDEDMREEVARTLREGGYDVIVVDSGARLVDYLGQSAVNPGDVRMPDVIVSDIRMPGYSGLEVLKAIQEVNWLNIPVVLMTAFGDRATHEEAKRLGAVATFNKPFDADDLLTAVMGALESPTTQGK